MLRDGLTTDGTVTFTRNSLSELLGELPAGEVQPVTQPADLTVEQVGEKLGRRPGTVRDWIRAGKLRAYMFGKEYRVTPAALEDFIQAQREGKPDRTAKQPAKVADLSRWRQVRDKAA